MPSNTNNIDHLKSILENYHQPQVLDAHPWTKSLMVMNASMNMPDLLNKSPGQRLVMVIARLFTQMRPANPPKHGKRLDTHWGEFGILAAQYFAPLLFGKPVPSSLREAWGYIDQSILLFVYGKSGESLSEAEKEPYKLVGNELSIAPNSTLSDWHRNGLERLIGVILRHESYLSGSMAMPAVINQDGQPVDSSIRKPPIQNTTRGRQVLILLVIVLLGLLFYDGIRSWKIYRQALRVSQDVVQMRNILSTTSPALERAKVVGPVLSTLRQDFGILKKETESFVSMARFLGWIPFYGGNLSSAQTMVEMADSFISSADIAYKAIAPLLEEESKQRINPTRLSELLFQVQPQIIEANRQINTAKSARDRLETNRLTYGIRDLLVDEIDPIITLLGDALSVAEELPRLMGATSEGPKSYLLLAQNEDELRPTGGFITAVGTLLMDKGQIRDLTFVNSYDLDDWTKPYPAAPWQLQQYMDASVLVLRDTSWYSDYPTAALYAENLFSYVNSHSVDGVIAFDQQFLVEILAATGPIELAGVTYPIDSSNVIDYMRTTKTPYAADRESNINDSTGMSKAIFMKEIASELVGKILAGDVPLEKLSAAVLLTLDERHLLLKIDSPSISRVLSNRRWDGAVRPETGDFLMLTDTNVGFNKTNVMVQTSMVYDVDLTKPASPSSSLTVMHTNKAAAVICNQAGYKPNPPPGEEKYLVTDCYWNYMRVYVPSGTKLVESTPQYVPANWMIVKRDIPARVDNLDEGIDGVQAFGTLQVIPGGESLSTNFTFSLPASIVLSEGNQHKYHLLIQKQPGTQALSFTVRVHLPSNASIKSAPTGAVIQAPDILYQGDLRTDIEITIVYQHK